jgi:hypothetical protein
MAKVCNALTAAINMEAQASNLVGAHATGAVKSLESDAKSQGDEGKKKIKGECIPQLEKVLKDAKQVLKDLNTLWDEASQGKLKAVADPKAFRAKAQAHISSARALEESGLKFKLSLDLGSGLYRCMGDVNVKATVVSIESFSQYYNTLKVDLNKL